MWISRNSGDLKTLPQRASAVCTISCNADERIANAFALSPAASLFMKMTAPFPSGRFNSLQAKSCWFASHSRASRVLACRSCTLRIVTGCETPQGPSLTRLTLRRDPDAGQENLFQIFDTARHVGRIYQAGRERWFRGLACDVTAPGNPPHGHEPSRDAALAKFKAPMPLSAEDRR
jgi:hypothetical protein